MSEQHDTPQQRTVSFKQAARFWLKLGLISFGGPAGQIAVMHRELVERRKWISETRFLHALNYCMLLPGPEAQQLATYIGWLLHKTMGGVVAGLLFVLPSVFILLALSYIYAAYGETFAVAAALAGFKPVVVAIVVEAVLKVGARALKSRSHFLIAAAAFVLIYFARVPFPLIVLCAALTGLVGARFLPESFAQRETAKDKNGKANQDKKATNDEGANKDDGACKDKNADETERNDLLLPDEIHLPSARRNVRLLIVFAILWLLPFLILLATRGATSLHAREYVFFTQTAFITFGGAYAVLAYVTQKAVEDFAWMNRAQAIDGLALAETTPGPLIMVLQFVGFIAAWNNPENMTPLASAILGAAVTTYATFLPCFMFIFIGAPYIERLRRNQTLNAALSGVTASVVGVIFNLALLFGASVIFPEGASGGINFIACASAVIAFLLLYKFKIDVVWIILLGGVSGLMLSLI